MLRFLTFVLHNPCQTRTPECIGGRRAARHRATRQWGCLSASRSVNACDAAEDWRDDGPKWGARLPNFVTGSDVCVSSVRRQGPFEWVSGESVCRQNVFAPAEVDGRVQQSCIHSLVIEQKPIDT